MILFDGIVAGTLLGVATGGRLSSLLVRRIRGEWLLVITLGVQVLLPGLDTGAQFPGVLMFIIWVLLMLATCGVALANVRVSGMLMVSIGIALNMLVISLNGAMPVSMEVVLRIDPAAANVASSADPFHEPISESTLLPFLADTIGVPGPPWHRGVASIGDLLLVLGLGVYCFAGTRTAIERPAPA